MAAVIDSKGKPVLQIQLNAGQTKINMAGLTNGFYIPKAADVKVFYLVRE